MLILIMVSLFSCQSMADFNWKNFKTSSIQLGTWLENYAQVRATQNDDKNGFALTPFMSVSSQYHLKPKHLIIPELGWVIQQSQNDIDKNIFFAKVDYSYQTRKWLRLRAGTSLMMLMQSGNGGEDTLNNADSTQVFYIPPERRTSYNQTLDLGIELIHKKRSLRFSTYTLALFREDERLTTYSLSYNYTFDTEKIW